MEERASLNLVTSLHHIFHADFSCQLPHAFRATAQIEASFMVLMLHCIHGGGLGLDGGMGRYQARASDEAGTSRSRLGKDSSVALHVLGLQRDHSL